MVWWKREPADVCGSCGCVSERRQDFFSKSGCGWWYSGRIFLQVFVVVACDMWCAQVWCAVRVFLLFFVQVFWEWICCIMWLVTVLFW